MSAAKHTPTPWVYIRSEPGLWTVGFYDPSGKWQSDSDHDSSEAAAERVGYLSGCNSHDALVACLSAALAVLKASGDPDARQLIADSNAALASVANGEEK